MQNPKIFEIIITTITNEPTSTNWTEIVNEIKQAGFNGNFIRVRSVLQFCIDEKLIQRENDVHTEKYFLLENGKTALNDYL